MEWMNRSDNSQQTANSPAPAGASSGAPHRRTRGGGIFKSLRVASVVLLFSVTILILALVAYTVLGGTTSGEGKYVKTKQMQAVFLNGGQVYFGHINNLNDKYIRMSDIYYLRVNQQVQPNQSTTSTTANDISLVKLGCELHGPDDQMLINREQVIFWENLKDNGQVAKAVSTYKTQNPNGQNCDQASSQSNSNSNTTTTPSTTNTTTTTPSTTNTTTKKP